MGRNRTGKTKAKAQEPPPPDAGWHAENSPRIMAATAPFMPSVVRLYKSANESGLDVAQIGSGCLLWHRGSRYLVTAGHVVGEKPNDAKYVGATTELIELSDGFRFNTKPGPALAKDPFDVAISCLSRDTADHMVERGLRFLTASEFGDDPFPASTPIAPRGERYAAIGYPETMWKRISNTSSRSDWIVYDSGVASPNQYAALGLTHAGNILMHFDRERVRTSTGVQKSRDLHGISGGAIFRMPMLERRGNVPSPRLVGIVIEEDRLHRVLVGVRIERILGAINRTPGIGT